MDRRNALTIKGMVAMLQARWADALTTYGEGVAIASTSQAQLSGQSWGQAPFTVWTVSMEAIVGSLRRANRERLPLL